MSPILGIWASGQQPALNATSYESIATVTVGAGGSSSISFSSIPSTYKHLQVRILARSSYAAATDYLYFKPNSDNTASKVYHRLYGDGSSASAGNYGASYFAFSGTFAGASATSGIFGVSVIDILDYANTSKYKTFRTLEGYDANGSGEINFISNLWMDTSAINSLTFNFNDNGGNIAQYSSFALYGVKG